MIFSVKPIDAQYYDSSWWFKTTFPLRTLNFSKVMLGTQCFYVNFLTFSKFIWSKIILESFWPTIVAFVRNSKIFDVWKNYFYKQYDVDNCKFHWIFENIRSLLLHTHFKNTSCLTNQELVGFQNLMLTIMSWIHFQKIKLSWLERLSNPKIDLYIWVELESSSFKCDLLPNLWNNTILRFSFIRILDEFFRCGFYK